MEYLVLLGRSNYRYLAYIAAHIIELNLIQNIFFFLFHFLRCLFHVIAILAILCRQHLEINIEKRDREMKRKKRMWNLPQKILNMEQKKESKRK